MDRLRRLHWSLVAVVLLALIAALPFLTRAGLPRHTDLELHVFRAAEYGQVLRDGVLYPRWAPDFYYGYGYPIFNYYAPLTYALANLFAIPAGIVAGVKGVILLAYLLAALGAYTLARRHFGSTAGVISAAAFVLSPYLLFIDPLMRGDLAEFFALSLLPWVFLAFERPAGLLDRSQALRVMSLGLLVLSHNLVGLIGAGMLAAHLAWRGFFLDGKRRWAGDAVAGVGAVLLTAIFWLPFILERGAIRLDVAGPGHFDYHNHFVALSTLLSPSPALDLGATTPKYIYNLGFVQWLLLVPAAIVALWSSFGIMLGGHRVAIIRRKDRAGKVTLFFAATSLLLIFLILPGSQFVWDAIPAAAYIQFPWRLLGPAAFTLAMCAGAVLKEEGGRMKDEGGRVKDETQKAKITPYVLRSTIVLSALLVAALPGMYPPLWNADFGDTSPRGMIDFELSGVALGTTSTGDFLPAAVGRVPPPTSSLLDSYSPSSGLVDKFDHSTLPQGATLRVEEHTARLDRFHVDAPVEFTARVLTFYFPGWQVTIDGTPAPIKPTNQSGFISFSVPAGDHTVEVSLDLTTPRRVGTIISLAALLALAALAVRPAQHTLRITPQASPIFAAQKREFVSGFSSFVICAMFLAAKVLVFDPCDTCFRYTSPAGEVLGEQHRQMANFGGHIELLGYDLPTTSVEPGQAIPLTLYWKATAPVPTNYQVFVQLTRPATTLWGQSDKLNPGDFPSTRWPLDKYVWDDHTLRVLPGTPPGEYRISIGLYTLADGRRAPVFDAQGNVAGDHVLLDTPIVVQRPGVSPDLDALQMQGRLDRDYNGARLLGWSVEAAQISTPNFARLTLFWRAEADRLPNLRTRAELIDPAGKPAQTIEAYPVQDAYPMTGWARGEIVRDQIAFWLPPDFPPDPYALRVSILAENGTILDTLDLTHIEVK